MSLNAEQQRELARFPPALRAMMEAELAAGNTIVEVGHSFPAPPAGAYLKLSRKVSTRPRLSGSGLDFYERNSSAYSGEFTDANRFYFVLEPPNPPPSEPDMDAIRRAAEPQDEKSVAMGRLAQRDPEPSGLAPGLKRWRDQFLGVKSPASPSTSPGPGVHLPPQSVLRSSTPTSASWLLHFRDRRPPQGIQFQLEGQLMILMPPRIESEKLVCHGDAKVNGASYSFRLTYQAALPDVNCYSLRIDSSWAALPATHHEYYRRTSGSWFELWTREFQRASPPEVGVGSAARYQLLSEAALKAEAQLNSVEAIEKAITAAMKSGASFSTAHKEGGTNLCWRNGRFLRSDYGESEERREFADEAEFLTFLRQFYDWETSRSVYPNKVSNLDAWRLILRLLRTR
jgi:hypothetical protein